MKQNKSKETEAMTMKERGATKEGNRHDIAEIRGKRRHMEERNRRSGFPIPSLLRKVKAILY
ncbi:hypothetical protein A2U01_0065022 [Trifolium medium]|uniref:Uncharacterized protein n=1 Tax=Trifolium medium TaxID=97028 RepID=A0A392S6H4_9FABA|nr:hypothetical protein [Trifolium medium]